MNARLRQRGMTLAELMIAMTLGLMLVLGLASLFTQTKRSFSQDEQVANMQANLRFAMEVLVRDATMAGFWGNLLDPSAVDLDGSLAIGTDCGAGTAAWAYVLDPPLGGVNDATAASAVAAFSCIDGSEVRPTTDILAIKRGAGHTVAGVPNACTGLDEGAVYLGENSVTGTLFQSSSDNSAVDTCEDNWQYLPAVYFIRDHSYAADDGIPTLCRKALQNVTGSTPTMVTECLVEGIEDLQVEYGLDTSGDGTANRYVSAPGAAAFADVASLRIHILARSLRADPAYTNPKRYLLGDSDYTPNDNFYRRSATTTVVLRNPANLRNMN